MKHYIKQRLDVIRKNSIQKKKADQLKESNLKKKCFI